MIKSLVFHIGDPKSGSTAIQEAMQKRVCHCDTVTIVPQEELNASALAYSLIPRRNPENYDSAFGRKRQWAQENDADLGIISAEFFSGVKPKALVRALEEYLPEHAGTARIVAYVRPHASRLLSGYAQQVKAGAYTGNLGSFIAQALKVPKLRYAGRFERWRTVFGDRFTLRPFVREEMRDGDVVADFFHVALQGAPFTLEPVTNSNESLTLDETAAMRLVQSVLTDRQVPAFLRLSVGGAIGRALGPLPNRSDRKLRLDRAGTGKIAALYRDDAQRLDAAFFTSRPMERALDEAVEKAAPALEPVAADRYFPAAEIDRLRTVSADLARLLKEAPQAWRRSYMAQIGQIPQEEAEAMPPAQARTAQAAWEALHALVGIMAGSGGNEGTEPDMQASA